MKLITASNTMRDLTRRQITEVNKALALLGSASRYKIRGDRLVLQTLCGDLGHSWDREVFASLQRALRYS